MAFAQIRKTMGKEYLQKREFESLVFYKVRMRCYETHKKKCQEVVGYTNLEFRGDVKAGNVCLGISIHEWYFKT